MSIQPVKTEGIAVPLKPKAQPAGTKSSPAQQPATDRVEIERQESLIETVRQEPGIRPEVLERAKALVNDPNYPSADVLSGVAKRLLRGL